MKVTGVPYNIRDYLSLCEIGYLLGSRMKVDMISSRKFDIVRIQVYVLEVGMIPYSMEIAVDNWLYDIYFEVEGEGREMNEGDNDDRTHEGSLKEDRHSEDRDPKIMKKQEDGKGDKSSGDGPATGSKQKTKLNDSGTMEASEKMDNIPKEVMEVSEYQVGATESVSIPSGSQFKGGFGVLELRTNYLLKMFPEKAISVELQIVRERDGFGST